MILLGLFLLLQACSYNVPISSGYIQRIDREEYNKNFTLTIKTLPEGEVLSTSAGKGNHTYTYSINKPLSQMLDYWFNMKFVKGVNNTENSIMITLTGIHVEDRRQDGILTDFPWIHSIDMSFDLEMRIDAIVYSEPFSFSKEFYINGGSQTIDIETNVNKMLQEIVATFDVYTTEKLIFAKPEGYIGHKLQISTNENGFRSIVLDKMELLVNESIALGLRIERESIDLADFKSKKYMSIRYVKDAVYNTRQNDMYQVAKIQFDEVIRKAISTLATNFDEPEFIYGYDLSVTTYLQDFVDRSEAAKKMEYRFLIPLEVAKQYKDKDITGRQLAERSIILLNDERITLDTN